MANNRLDIIIFGATGFTGKYTVKEAARLAKQREFKFGVAGRRKEALESVVKEFAPGIENVPIVIADLKDEKSLTDMTEQAKVIVNCCGPYRFYGEPVIKACIATKTHHVDVSGEPYYMEKIQLDYNEAAQKAGIYIISACGVDSIPFDLGVVLVQQKFEGELNSVEGYLQAGSKSKVSGASLNYGTWESAVYGYAQYGDLRPLRSKLFPQKLPKFSPKLKSRGPLHYSSVTNGWSVPFPGSDRSVAIRTQRFLYEKYKQRPVQVQCYVTFKSLMTVFLIGIIGAVFGVLAKFECGRNLLLKYPAFFTAGFVTHEGPKPEVTENTEFTMTLKGLGWKEKLSEPTDKHTDAPKKELIVKVTAMNPGYGATCTAVLISALTILNESEKMPENGGVFTPGGAFSRTSIIEELNKNGMTFEVVSSSEK